MENVSVRMGWLMSMVSVNLVIKNAKPVRIDRKIVKVVKKSNLDNCKA